MSSYLSKYENTLSKLLLGICVVCVKYGENYARTIYFSLLHITMFSHTLNFIKSSKCFRYIQRVNKSSVSFFVLKYIYIYNIKYLAKKNSRLVVVVQKKNHYLICKKTGQINQKKLEGFYLSLITIQPASLLQHG